VRIEGIVCSCIPAPIRRERRGSRRGSRPGPPGRRATAETDFSVGDLPTSPQGTARFVPRVLVALAAVRVAVPVLVVAVQEPFATSTFEFGSLTEVEGLLTDRPFPMLRARMGRGGDGEDRYRALLLVAPGKFGASSMVEELRRERGAA